MRRRQYLATTAALVAPSLAGCAHPEAVLQMDAVSDRDVARRASRDVSRHPEAGGIVAGAVENGTTTVSDRSRPLDTDRPVVYEGRYYRLTVTETGERETTWYSIRIDYDPGTGTPEGAVVDYDDLPAVDRDALDSLLPPPEGVPSGEGYDFGVGREFTDEDAASSALVPEQEYVAVVYEGLRYPIDVGDGRTVTVTDYRYEAEEIAASAEAFGAAVREEYTFELSGLTDGEREIVEEAIDGGYYEGEVTDAFASLAGRFRERRALEADEWGGEWVARYEGTVYWTDLQHPPGEIEG
jgi:hypothetical protein